MKFQLNFDSSTSRCKRKAKKWFLIFKTALGKMLASANGNESMENQTRWMGWYWKQKPTWRKDLITYSSHTWIMFSFIDWLSFGGGWGGGRLKLDFQGQGGRIIFNVARARGGSWKFDNFRGRHMCIVPVGINRFSN